MKSISKLSTTMSQFKRFLSIKMLIASAFLFLFQTSFAQKCNPYFPLNEGKTYEFKTYDQKDKLQSSKEHLITNVKSSNAASSANVNYTSRDKKGKETVSGSFELKCSNGTMEIDMASMLGNIEQLSNFKDMEKKIEGDFLDLPSNLTKGQKLKNGKITASVSNMGMKLFSMMIVITDRMVEDFVSVTTPAGTFDCVKISYTSRSKILVKTFEFKIVEYYSKEVGLVKSEEYKLKDNSLQSYTQLESIK